MMQEFQNVKMEETDNFAADIDKGLSAPEKKISSKYLYNKEGSNLFEEIMDLPEYYPSRCEMEILQKNKNDILQNAYTQDELYVVDLGAGNGRKTIVLLNYFKDRVKLRYVPIDISKSALDNMEVEFGKNHKDIVVESIHSEYISGLLSMKTRKNTKKMVLFLGSTIGNFTFTEAFSFLEELQKVLNTDDELLIGFDLKKDPQAIRAAYYDSKGITARFNLNLLRRINDELGGNFDLDKFIYYPTYNPVNGELISHLVSKEKQEVKIASLNKTYSFEQWETLHTECSNKYDIAMVNMLASQSGFEIIENYYDKGHNFLDSLWRVK